MTIQFTMEYDFSEMDISECERVVKDVDATDAEEITAGLDKYADWLKTKYTTRKDVPKDVRDEIKKVSVIIRACSTSLSWVFGEGDEV